MKKIQKLELLPSQLLCAEDMQSVCAGGGYVEDTERHTWICNCTSVGNICYETRHFHWEQTWQELLEDLKNPLNYVPFYYLYSNTSPYTMYYPKKLRRIQNGTKDHKELTPYQVYDYILA